MLKPMKELSHKDFAKYRARQNQGTMRVVVKDNQLYYYTEDVENYALNKGRPIKIKQEIKKE